VPDVPPKSLRLDLKPTSLIFTGTSETKKTTYHLEMEFFGEIDVENSKTHHTAANIQMILRKKELKEEYWPRLLKDPAKVHYLRTDFDKVCAYVNKDRLLSLAENSNANASFQWVDEDEQNEAPEDDYMNQFGGGLGEDGGFGGIDFSKLGGGGGGDMPGMEGLGAGDGEAGEDDGDDDDEDDEMPDLEEDDAAEGDAKGKGKGKDTD